MHENHAVTVSHRKFIPGCKLTPIAEHMSMYEITSPDLMLLPAIGADFSLEVCNSGRIMTQMPRGPLRKVFLVVAGGNAAAERHFEDTIQRTRTLDEVRGFLPLKEIEQLERIYHGSNFIVWGA